MKEEAGVKLSQTLYARAEKIWPRYLCHPFVTQMADGTLPPEKFLYGDNVFEKDGIRRDRTGDGEKTRCLCGKRGIFNRDGPAMGPQIIRQLE